MFVKSVLSVSFVLISASTQSASGSVAISCKGSAESTYKGKIDRSWPTRVYVLDQSRNWVAYWNADKEEQIPACDSKWQSCSITFGPRVIEAKGNLNKLHGFYMTIDRRTGFLSYASSSGPDSKWEFAGTCSVTEMPLAEIGDNKF